MRYGNVFQYNGTMEFAVECAIYMGADEYIASPI
jgi:hypothetical protein